MSESEQGKTADVLQKEAFSKSLKMVERMTMQNTFVEVAFDFKYWEDEADAVRVEEGTLLPLWKFV